MVFSRTLTTIILLGEQKSWKIDNLSMWTINDPPTHLKWPTYAPHMEKRGHLSYHLPNPSYPRDYRIIPKINFLKQKGCIYTWYLVIQILKIYFEQTDFHLKILLDWPEISRPDWTLLYFTSPRLSSNALQCRRTEKIPKVTGL